MGFPRPDINWFLEPNDDNVAPVSYLVNTITQQKNLSLLGDVDLCFETEPLGF